MIFLHMAKLKFRIKRLMNWVQIYRYLFIWHRILLYLSQYYFQKYLRRSNVAQQVLCQIKTPFVKRHQRRSSAALISSCIFRFYHILQTCFVNGCSLKSLRNHLLDHSIHLCLRLFCAAETFPVRLSSYDVFPRSQHGEVNESVSHALSFGTPYILMTLTDSKHRLRAGQIQNSYPLCPNLP